MSHRTRTGIAFGAAAALTATALLAGPVAAQDETALVYAIDGEISALNNAADDVPTDEANTWLHNALYTLDESLTPQPDIAADLAEISEDGLTWTIKLREDVFFQPTGEQVTAEDVVFTYELANSDNCKFNPDACLAFVTVTPEGSEEAVKVLQSVTALDDFTVEFQLADRYAPFSTVSLPSLWIDSKTATEAAFAEFQESLGAVTAVDVDALIEAGIESETFVADAEALLSSAEFVIPDVALHQNDDGSLNEESYATALNTSLGELSTILNSSEIDQIAAAYKLIETARMPVGTGLFTVTEFRPGQDITAVRNETYHWGPSTFDTLYMPIIKDDVAASAALAGGDIDWKYSLTADGYEQLRENNNVKFALYPDFGYFNMQFNLREGRLFADKPVRQALAYCIDKEATVEAATDGQGVPIYADIPPASWAYNPDVKKYEYDVDMANQMLDEAGWTMGDDGVRVDADGRRLETHILLRAGKPDRSKFMQLLADQAKDCGYNLTLEEADFGTVLLPGLEWPLIMAGQSEQWDAYFGGWGTSYDPDPYSLYHSNNIVTEDLPDTYNYIGFSNERADELIEAGLRELDQAKRAEIYQEFEAIMAEELPALWAWSDEERQGLNAALQSDVEWDESVMSTPTWFWELEKVNKGGLTVRE
jgi:ABC-type transport system substrate-binding protein